MERRKETGMSGTDGLSNHIRKYLLDKTNYTCEIQGVDAIY